MNTASVAESPELATALSETGIAPEEVLELSRARWANEETGPTEVLVVLLREQLLLLEKRRKLWGGAQAVVVSKPFSKFKAVGSDDEFFGHSIFMLAYDEDDTFLLNWPDAHERDRMFKAIFHAHNGNFAPWGLKLDPADYVSDFDRYYAELVAEGPTDTHDWHAWIEERYGEFEINNALGLASDWRYSTLSDAAGGEPSMRVARIGSSWLWANVGPEAQRVVVRLGEELFDGGLLEPPYDEETFHTGEGLSRSDAGPSRLIALMTLTGYAKSLGHPRADEWLEGARRGMPTVPASVLSPSLRDLWAGIEELPRA
jgi:hypothetical protein